MVSQYIPQQRLALSRRNDIRQGMVQASNAYFPRVSKHRFARRFELLGYRSSAVGKAMQHDGATRLMQGHYFIIHIDGATVIGRRWNIQTNDMEFKRGQKVLDKSEGVSFLRFASNILRGPLDNFVLSEHVSWHRATRYSRPWQ